MKYAKYAVLALLVLLLAACGQVGSDGQLMRLDVPVGGGDEPTHQSGTHLLEFGDVCPGSTSLLTADVGIRRQGGSNVTFKSDSVVTISELSASSGLSATGGQITMPSDWEANSANSIHGYLESTVSLTIVDEDFTGEIVYRASGTSADGEAMVRDSPPMTVTATVLPADDPACAEEAAWTFSGFHQPVAQGDNVSYTGFEGASIPIDAVVNVVKGGSTVPLKFNVFDDEIEMSDVVDVTAFRATKISCNGAGDENAPDDASLSSGNTSLRYSGTPGDDGQFIQNWKTPKVSSNTCYVATVTVNDGPGSTLSAFFELRR